MTTSATTPISASGTTGSWAPSSATFLTDLYNNTSINEALTNTMPQPAGPNTVVLFKSCFPNSGGISGNPNDPPRISSPSRSQPHLGRQLLATRR